MGKKKPRALPETMALPEGGVESHAHLDMEQFEGEVDAVIARAAACGVTRIGQVYLGPQAYQDNKGLFAGHPGVFGLLGVHPHDAKDLDDAGLAAMAEAFGADEGLRAVGEIGLDFFYDLSPRDVQLAGFKDQLALAREVDRPVVVHSRDAWDETMDALADLGFKDRPVLIHCFGGGPEQMRQVVDNGWMLSIPGPVTYAKNEPLRRAVAVAPAERIVLETDSPFLAPDPWRGKRNEPAYLVFTAHAVAALRGEDPAALWRLAAANAERFFGLRECPGVSGTDRPRSA